MRNAFVNTLIDCARQDPAVALLMAEVGFSVVEPFEKEFPSRFYNTGIAEQNLVLTAAGMALEGRRPVAYSMSAFLASRAFELIKVSVCYQDLPVVLASIGTGLSYSELGATHHATEESALMRALPNLNVFFPADGAELSEALRFALRAEHPSYISFPKLPDKPLPAHPFEMGKAVRYRDGGDGAVLAIGHSVVEALAAAQALEQQGIRLSVYGFHTVKPFDRSAVLEACATGSLFVVDEHQQCAGIAGEAAKAVLEGGKTLRHFCDYSIPDCFSDHVARYAQMQEEYGLSAARLAQRIGETLGGGR